MSVISVREGYSGVTGGGEADNKTFTRCFSVVTDNPADDPVDLDNALPLIDPTDPTIIIPAPGTVHPKKNSVRSQQPQFTKVSPTFFNVRVNYSSRTTSWGTHNDDGDDPLSKPAEEKWGSSSITQNIGVDADNVVIANSRGKPFVGGLPREFRDEVLTIARNEASYDALNWVNTVNAVQFRHGAPGRARMCDVRVNPVLDDITGEELYVKVEYEIRFRFWTSVERSYYFSGGSWHLATNADKFAWFQRTQNTDLEYFDSAGNLHKIDNGQPELIDLNGYIVSAANAVFLLFRDNPEKTWSGLT